MGKYLRRSAIEKVKILQVVYVESIVGKGVQDDPSRRIYEIYDLKGNLITRLDPWKAQRESEARARVLPFFDQKALVFNAYLGEKPGEGKLENQTLNIVYSLDGADGITQINLGDIVKSLPAIREYLNRGKHAG